MSGIPYDTSRGEGPLRDVQGVGVHGAGSNVDVGSREEIDAELRARSRQFDDHLRMYKDAAQTRAEAKVALLDEEGSAFQRAAKELKTDKVTTIRKAVDADERVKPHRAAVIRAEATMDYAQKFLDATESQISAAQSRSKMWMKQHDFDTRGPQ